MEMETIASDNKPQPWSISLFRPEDAPKVVELYQAIYGDNYPVPEVYNPKQLIRQNDNGDTYRMIARTAADEVVGHIAFYRSSPPNRQLYEHGQLMVRYDYRRSDMAYRLVSQSLAELPQRYGLEQIWGEAVCNHLFTQRTNAQQDFSETALEVDLMPAESYARALGETVTDPGRVSTITAFRAFKYKPQTIFIPPAYEAALKHMYGGVDFGHIFILSEAPLPIGYKTGSDMQLFPTAGIARINFHEVGEDFADCLIQLEEQAIAGGTLVLQVFIKLTCPCSGAAVQLLRQAGYFLGGPLPRWFDDDGFLMQKTIFSPNFDGIHLYTKRAKKILEFVKEDWQSISRHV